MHNCHLNDAWGYTDEMNNEYAIVGTTEGTSIVDITTPTAPTEVFWEPGMNSIWRDLKTHGDYAYVTTEALNGLLIIDMGPLPGSTLLTTNYYTGPIGNQWESAHNIWVDENGYAYIFGSNRGNGGVIILDVFTDPMNPVEVGTFDDWYVHDGYVRNDTMFLAHINDGFFSMVDVTDKANPVLLGIHNTPNTFSHNIWPDINMNVAFTTDEVSAGYVAAYDVSDPANIFELDRIQSSPGNGVIPHNVHVLNNFLVTSYYSDGVVIHDATYPYNLIEVGNYDTYPTQTTSYDGCWGVYPFFPSGNIVAADQTEGLFVLGPTYTQAAYLEGVVTDQSTLNPVDQVDVVISGSNQNELTSSIGFYATGMAAAGSYDVTYSKVGYYPQTVTVSLQSGIITTQDIQLVPIPQYPLTVEVFDAVTMNPIDNANVKLVATLITHEGATNALGQEQFSLYYEEPYDMIVGKWGYVTTCSTQNIDAATGTLTVYLDPGIYDDFSFDFGWTTSGSALTGQWERGIPYGNNNGSAPGDDIAGDCGDQCFVTGNDPNTVPDAGDVDGGPVTLISPVMDLTSYTVPYVDYMRWFYCNFGPNPEDDTLRVFVSDGTNTVEIDKIGRDVPTFGQWVPMTIKLSDFVSITTTMQFFFVTSDLDPDVNITEAALDVFRIVEESDLSLDEMEKKIAVYPNPFSDIIFVEGVENNTSYSIHALSGQLIDRGEVNAGQIQPSDLSDGIYILNIGDARLKVIKLK